MQANHVICHVPLRPSLISSIDSLWHHACKASLWRIHATKLCHLKYPPICKSFHVVLSLKFSRNNVPHHHPVGLSVDVFNRFSIANDIHDYWSLWVLCYKIPIKNEWAEYVINYNVFKKCCRVIETMFLQLNLTFKLVFEFQLVFEFPRQCAGCHLIS